MQKAPRPRLRWYRTASGNAPVKEFLDNLSDLDHAAIVTAMHEVQHEGLASARRLVSDLWEVRAVGVKAHYRLIFCQEGRRILLALDIFDKNTQRTPLNVRRRSEQRLQDWRSRSGRV
jgi:phage-related protein